MKDTSPTSQIAKQNRLPRQWPSRSSWLDRWLHKLGAAPQRASTAAALLIQQTPSASNSTLVWKIHEWLWREHSTIGALGVGLAISLAIFDLCVGAALCAPISNATSDDLAMLNTLAQVAGGAFGTVITVVVFAIGLVSQRTDGTAMYTPFVARRYHVFVVAAAAAAICLVNAVGPLMGQPLGLVAVKYLLLSNIVTMPLVVVATVWLMCRVIEAAGGTDLVSTLPVFRAAMRRIAAHDRLLAATAQHFLSALGDSPLKLNVFAGYSSLVKADSRYFGTGVERLVIDVDLHVLQQIIDLASRFDKVVEFSVLAAPSLIGVKRGILHLAIDPARELPRPASDSDGPNESSPATAPASLETVLGVDRLAQLSILANRLFRYGERPETDSDLRQFFARAQADLERLALSGDSVTFKARIEDYQKLVGEWLAAAGPTATTQQSRLFAYREPRFVGPLEIDLADILRASVRSGDFHAYEAAVDGVSELLYDADSHSAAALYVDASGLLAFAFYLAMQKPEFRAQARDLFDRHIDSLLMARKSLRYSFDEANEVQASPEDNTESGMRHAIIGSLLSMIRYAIEAGEAETAKMLIDRLTRQTDPEHRRVRVGESAPSQADGESLVQYALIVIVGWCHHMIREKHAEHASAYAVMEHALNMVPPRHSLIGLWELYHGAAKPRAEVDEQLRVSRWDLRDDERRVGFVYTSSGGNEWIADGFWVAMLRCRSPHKHELRDFFQSPPSRWLWKSEGLDERLSRLQSALTGMGTADEQKAARVSVVELVRQRQRVGDAVAIRAIVQTPLSPKRQEGFTKDIVDGVAKHRKLPEMLSAHPDAMPTATMVPVPAVVLSDVHRDYLLDINNWGGEYGDWIAQNIVRREWQQLIYTLEQALPDAAVSFSLVSASDAVRSATQAISSRGFKADLLILPPQDRFACALFRRPLWDQKIGKRADWGNASVGVWEGLTVLRCPYENTSSVIVADSRALFGNAGPSSAQPVVKITDLSEAEKQELLSKVTEVGTEPLLVSDDLRVATLVSLRPTIGIADLTAAYRLDLTNGDACFAMEPDDNLYHRATCSAVDGAEHLVFSLSRRLEGEAAERTPCDVCHPERWDSEARLLTKRNP